MSWKSSAAAGLGVTALLWVGTAGALAAEPGLAIKQRQAVMSSIGTHMGGIKGAVLAGNGEAAAAHATAINKLSTIIPTLFPEGSDKGKTDAKPEIWQKWSEFENAAKNLTAESGKLIEAAKGGDKKAMVAQFESMGKNGCGGCHKPFRVPKD